MVEQNAFEHLVSKFGELSLNLTRVENRAPPECASVLAEARVALEAVGQALAPALGCLAPGASVRTLERRARSALADASRRIQRAQQVVEAVREAKERVAVRREGEWCVPPPISTPGAGGVAEQPARQEPAEPAARGALAAGGRRAVLRAAAAVAVALGSGVLLGRALGVPALTAPAYGMAPLRMNAAIAFVLIGLALLLSARTSDEGWNRLLAQTCAVLAAQMGLLDLVDLLFESDLPLDPELLSRAPDAWTSAMPPNTALCFLSLGVVVLLVEARLWPRLRRALGLGTLLVSAAAAVGYLVHAAALYTVAAGEMAASAALGLVIVSSALLIADLPGRRQRARLPAPGSSVNGAARRGPPGL